MSYNGHPAHPHLYRQDDLEFVQPPVQYQEFADYSSHADRYADSAAGESRPAMYPSSSSQIHPHPLFTRQDNTDTDGPSSQNRSLDPHVLNSHHQIYQSPSPFTNIPAHHHQPHHSHHSPQSWPPYDHSIPQPFPAINLPLSYAPYPTPSSLPPPRLSPPPVNHQSFHFKAPSQNNTSAASNHRLTLAGSLDPSTGIFYRTPEHPRLRTAQACEKCRTRKAKCSGEHPSCKRCITRGLVCEYAKEGRVRGPNKPKPKGPPGTTSGNNDFSVSKSATTGNGRPGSRNRTSSANSSAGSSEHQDLPHAVRSALIRVDQGSPSSRGNGRRSSGSSRRNSLSLGEHRSSRPRPPDLHLETASNLFRLSNGDGPRSTSVLGERIPDPRFVPFQQHRAGITHGHNREYQIQQQLQLQRNLMAIQAQGQVQANMHPSSSVSSLKRLPRGISQTQNEHSMPLSIPPPHNLIHVGMNANLVSPEQRLDEQDFMYPPPACLQNARQQQEHQDDSRGSLSSAFSATATSCNSPHTSVETTSTMGSPLTPASTSMSSSLIAASMIQQRPSQQGSGSVNARGIELDFDLDPDLAPTSLTTSQQVTPDSNKHSHPSQSPNAMNQQQQHHQYHPSMDLQMC